MEYTPYFLFKIWLHNIVSNICSDHSYLQLSRYLCSVRFICPFEIFFFMRKQMHIFEYTEWSTVANRFLAVLYEKQGSAIPISWNIKEEKALRFLLVIL